MVAIERLLWLQMEECGLGEKVWLRLKNRCSHHLKIVVTAIGGVWVGCRSSVSEGCV